MLVAEKPRIDSTWWQCENYDTPLAMGHDMTVLPYSGPQYDPETGERIV